MRSTARGAGLSIVGDVIVNPGQRLVLHGSPPGPDAPADVVSEWNALTTQVTTQNAKVDAFALACIDADEIIRRLVGLIDSTAATSETHDTTLVGLAAEFLTAGISAALVLRVAPILRAQATWHLDEAARLRNTARSGVGARLSATEWDDLWRRINQHDADARTYRERHRTGGLPRNIGRALGIFGVLATGYGIYQDIQDGESVGQAITSNVGGFLAGAASGAATGAVIGTFIGGPAGTVVGILGGAIVGTVVGAFTSGAIDALWENGVTAVSEAWEAGVDAVQEVGSAIGDLATGAWDALFG